MRERGADALNRGPGQGSGLPADLTGDVERAGFYPAVVLDALDVAVAGEQVRAFLVHPETTFDRVEVRRHLTVLALTPTRLVVAHADDHDPDASISEPYASTSTEAVPLHQVTTVVMSHSVAKPERHTPGNTARELSLTIGWGALARIDLEPASCADPDCEADHGYTGTVASDDITVRVSAEAEGEASVRAAARFARELSAATAHR
ncbi:DUF5998 family protein [Spongisporangium articulatum]|uniref:DUF5998 family protein n=1 Tax=Spongisporangium articulatum TaxID=3362603 RepID=A0ABW8AT27_9ACTN